MTDRAFMKSFGGLILALVSLTVILFIIAQIVGGKESKSVEATADAKTIAERIKPVGEVSVATAAPGSPVMEAIIPSAIAAGDDKGKKVYDASCAVCHAAGVADAPKLGDKAAWAPRLKAGMDAVYANAIKGKGAMPPKGTYQGPDADVKAAVDYMASKAK
ncbi:MAG: c-type cytochrome [Sulfuricaulis sp.]